MGQASYKLLSIERVQAGAIRWRGVFTGSDGFKHWEHVTYELTPTSEHSPAAAQALAAAVDDAGVIAAVKIDAERLLRDLEDPNNPAGYRGPVAIELPDE